VEGRGEAAPEVTPQSLHGKAFERVDLGNHARRVPLVRVFPEFAHCELHGLVGRGKVSEQIRELRNRQELVLGHPRVLVHWFSHDCKVDWGLQKTLVFFLVAVAEEQHL